MADDPGIPPHWRSYPLFEALHSRRSRRVGIGTRVPGPLAHHARAEPVPLTEEEEAVLAFAACGFTGPALDDVDLAPDGAATMMSGLQGRTVASLDAIQAVAVAVTNDEATYLLRRPADLAPQEVARLGELSAARDYVGLAHASRVHLRDGRARPDADPGQNVALNRWGLHAPGSSYFLPINDLTYAYVNVLLEVLAEHSGWFIVDERRSFLPAGLARFARRKGGHLDDDPAAGRTVTIGAFERALSELLTVEQGMVAQNLGLACEALGLGGYTNFAGFDAPWFQELGFRMGSMPASRFLGMAAPLRLLLRARQDPPVHYPLGLETADGEVLLRSYAPPYFPSMRAAVEAVVQRKLGPDGIYRERVGEGAWKDPGTVAAGIPEISDAAVEATVAYCEYVAERYGRFPAHVPPFRAVCGFQAQHLDTAFYDRYYRPGVLPDQHRRHFLSGLHRDGAPSSRS